MINDKVFKTAILSKNSAMSTIEEVLTSYDAKIINLVDEMRVDKTLGYKVINNFKELNESYKSNSELLDFGKKERVRSSLKLVNEAIKLKYFDYPHPGINVFYGGLMGSLLDLLGFGLMVQGITQSNFGYIASGLSTLSLGAFIQTQRIYANVKHGINVNEILDKAKDALNQA